MSQLHKLILSDDYQRSGNVTMKKHLSTERGAYIQFELRYLFLAHSSLVERSLTSFMYELNLVKRHHVHYC